MTERNSRVQRAALGMLGPGGLSGGSLALRLPSLPTSRSLDSVAPDVYVQLLREKVPGVKIGHVERGAVVWE